MTSKVPGYFLILLTLSAFGPYVLEGIGIRLEHFVIYPTFAIAGLFFIFKFSSYKVEKYLFIFLGFWALIFVWIFYISVGIRGSALSGASLSSVENFLQPLAIILIFIVLSRYYRLSGYLELVTRTFLIALCLNSALIIFQIIIDPELFGILDYFVRENQENSSVAERAASMGRYLGIFDQPLEAGASYSLGLLGWAYLENAQKNFKGWIRYLLLLIILIGGLVTVSKVFVIGGIGLFTGYILFFSRPRVRRRFIYAIPVLVGVISYYLVTSMWQGLSFLLRLFSTTEGTTLLARFTAGRFGAEEGAVIRVFRQVLHESPLYGFGFTPPPILDNGFAEIFYHGGGIGLAIYIVFLVWIGSIGFKKYVNNGKSQVLLLFLFALILGLNLGAPVFTLNRFSVHITTFLCLIFLGNERD